ncbi:MAG TPA: helix-turn-helix domain-containing protein [Puia sp.]|nr:helix-turn-helix domain-containing protein [Puia sp.]
MENTDSGQQVFFQHIKNNLPQHLSLVDEIADILNISTDSAYRRIRGEKPISFDEIKKLCSHFKISLDNLFQLNSDSYVFTGTLINNTDFNYDKWLQSCLEIIRKVKTYQPHHMSYLAKEFPFFYYFLIPEIAAFKSFFFMKSILFYEEWKGARFSVKDDYSKYHEVWRDLSKTFATIPGTEIWNVETITSTMRQIEFYHATGAFRSDDDVICLFEKIQKMLDHIELQAEYGVKLFFGQQPTTANGAPFNLYLNELIMGDNMQILQLGNKHFTYLNHTILNYMMTTNEKFNAYMKKTMDVICTKSIPISVVNEKERLIFFNSLRTKIETAKQKIFSPKISY